MRGWDLAVVVLAAIPALVLAGGICGVFTARLQARPPTRCLLPCTCSSCCMRAWLLPLSLSVRLCPIAGTCQRGVQPGRRNCGRGAGWRAHGGGRGAGGGCAALIRRRSVITHEGGR